MKEASAAHETTWLQRIVQTACETLQPSIVFPFFFFLFKTGIYESYYQSTCPAK